MSDHEVAEKIVRYALRYIECHGDNVSDLADAYLEESLEGEYVKFSALTTTKQELAREMIDGIVGLWGAPNCIPIVKALKAVAKANGVEIE